MYLLDSKNKISRNILLNFSYLKSVEIKTWKRSKPSLIMCSNHDFSAHFFSIEKIIIESVSFDSCGISEPILLLSASTIVQINRSSFLGSGQNSILIQTNVSELQVTNCVFPKGKAIAVHIQSDSVSNASFNNVSFSHNEAGSIKIDSTILTRVSELVISNCSFLYSFTNESIAEVNSIHSVIIIYSFFRENSVRNALLTKNTKEVRIAECFIDSNTAYSNTISCTNSAASSDTIVNTVLFLRSSLFIISNTSALM